MHTNTVHQFGSLSSHYPLNMDSTRRSRVLYDSHCPANACWPMDKNWEPDSRWPNMRTFLKQTVRVVGEVDLLHCALGPLGTYFVISKKYAC